MSRRSAVKLLSKDEARRIAVNIAKLPELVHNSSRAGLPVEKRSVFLERVAARLQLLGSFTDRDFDDAVRLALRGLIQEGNVQSYVLEIQSPNTPYTYKSVISLHGAFGLAILYFVPRDGQLGENQKRAGQDIFDIYYWMDSWLHFTDLLRNEKPVHFQYDDSNNTAQISSVRAPVPGGSSRFADRFIKAHFLSRQKPQDRQGASQFPQLLAGPTAAKLLTRDEARRIAVNIAKLPELVRQ